MKQRKFINSPITGIVMSLIVNILTILLLINLGDFVSVSKRIFVMIVSAIILMALLVNGLFILGYGYRRNFFRKLFVGLSVLIIIAMGITAFYISRFSNSLDALIDTENVEKLDYHFVTVDETISLNTMGAEHTIGYVGVDAIFNGNIDEEISKHSSTVQIVEYDSYRDLMDDFLLGESVDVAILPSQFMSYAETMDEDSQDRLLHAEILHTFNVQIQGDKTANAKVLEDPFSVLFIGVNENLADSIILATINPKTLHVTMTSIARDSYVPISCYRGVVYDKINHSRSMSRNCLIETVEDLFDIDIDFFFETDFYALVKIVDVLGGLEIESPISFGGSLPKEDNPREFHEIHVPAGKNLLNGYQVITFARERAHFLDGDFQRQLNQQYVIKELANKIISESRSNVETLIKVLQAAENNIVMNLSVNRDISPLLGLVLNNIMASPVDAMNTFVIQNTQIYGTTPTIRGMSVVVPYRYSLEDNKTIIHNNLSGIIHEPEANPFAFSLNRPYKFDVDTDIYQYLGTPLSIDTSLYPEPEPEPKPEPEPETYTLPFFIDMTLDEARNWADNNGVTMEIEWVSGETENKIIWQSIAAGEYDTPIDYIVLEVESGMVETPVDPGEGEEQPVEPPESEETEGDAQETEQDETP